MFETTNQLFTSKYKWARAVNPAIARKKSANCGSSQVPPGNPGYGHTSGYDPIKISRYLEKVLVDS